MIFTCKTTNLNKAIQTVQRAISSKPSTPIFSGIHLIADNNILVDVVVGSVNMWKQPKNTDKSFYETC